MRLTNELRDEFLNKVDKSIRRRHKFDDSAYTEAVKALVEEKTPNEVFDFKKKYPRFIGSGTYVKVETPLYGTMYFSALTEENYPKVDEKKLAELGKKYELYNKEQERIKEATRKLRGIAYSCSTLKKLKEALPELVKFMPEETTGQKYLPVSPVIGEVVSELLSLGVPMGDKDEASAPE